MDLAVKETDQVKPISGAVCMLDWKKKIKILHQEMLNSVTHVHNSNLNMCIIYFATASLRKQYTIQDIKAPKILFNSYLTFSLAMSAGNCPNT